MRMIATILDGRFSGLATGEHAPVVALIRARYKWAFWRKQKMLWGVVQPKREVIGRGVELVWRHIAVFTDRSAAVAFLEEMTFKDGEGS
jgi:hypothetical protein